MSSKGEIMEVPCVAAVASFLGLHGDEDCCSPRFPFFSPVGGSSGQMDLFCLQRWRASTQSSSGAGILGSDAHGIATAPRV